MKITDKMRLDWLQKYCYENYYKDSYMIVFWGAKEKTARQAIDAAIKSESKDRA